MTIMMCPPGLAVHGYNWSHFLQDNAPALRATGNDAKNMKHKDLSQQGCPFGELDNCLRYLQGEENAWVDDIAKHDHHKNHSKHPAESLSRLCKCL